MSKNELTVPERILETSLRLFNESGFQTITVRKISQQLDISAGHVGYHFKTKTEIALALFPRLESEIRHEVLNVVKPGQTFTGLVGARDAIGIVRTMWRYRFIFGSLNVLLEVDDNLRLRYRDLQESIISFAETAFTQLIDLKEMSPPRAPNSARTLAETWWKLWLGWLRMTELDFQKFETLPDAVLYEGALKTYGIVSPYFGQEFSDSFIRNAREILPDHKLQCSH